MAGIETYNDIQVEIYISRDPWTGKQITGIMIRRDEQNNEGGIYSAEYLGVNGWNRVGDMQTIPGYLQLPAENVTIEVNSKYRPKHLRKES